ncbi:MAG: Ig-like domain-containing protein [Bacilli bacterium]|nr:Ig-like domain-containing protein [Bacilli bacterium]
MKHNKLFAMLAVAAALAVSGCTGPGSSSASVHKHTAAPDAPWKYDNNNHWKDCEANDGGKAENAKHAFGDPTDVVPATCTAEGSQKVKCTVCGAEVTQTLQKIDHTWGEWETITAATCTEAGSRKHTCSVCQTEETETVQATGHQWGEWETVKEADCENDGSRKHTCSVCGVEESETVEKLGHQLVAVGGEQQASEGEATVRLYKCERCGDTYLGFSADEPSAASKPHLMKGDNDGMRFFGRPIGNAMALTADGTSVNQQNNECVYCSTETGDFFEYIFTLNEEQATTLATARLYCDARPANYLSGDFWAYNRSADDWTPGYYIDGADDHVQHNEDGTVMMVKDHAQATKNEDGSWTEGVETENDVKMGARIEDYRYILYVDDQPVDFDKDTEVPVKGSQQNMQRAEYVLPYTFNLHKGQNKISLRMAGGYRSEFYNFIFRPYVAPTPVQVNETSLEIREGKTAQITSSMEGLTYKSSSNSVATVDDKGVVTGVKAGTATITVSKEGNYKDAKVAVTVLEKEGIVTLNLGDGVLNPADGADPYNSSYSGNWLRNFKKDTTLTYTFDAEVAGKFDIQLGLRGAIADLSTVMAIKVNDADVAVSGSVNSNSSAVDTVVGQADLKVGSNTMVITILVDDSGLYLKTLKFLPYVPHVHEFANEQDVAAKGEGYVGYKVGTCAADNAKQIKIAAMDGTFAAGSGNKTGNGAPLEGYLKIGGNNQSISYKFDWAGEAKTAKIYQYGYMDSFSGNLNRTYTSKQNGQTLGANGCNFGVNFNNQEVEITDEVKAITYEQFFAGATVSPGGNGNSNLAACIIGEVALANGDNTFTFTRYASYNLSISFFLIVIE